MLKILSKIYILFFRRLSGKFTISILSLILSTTLILSFLSYNREKKILLDSMLDSMEKQKSILEEVRNENIKREKEFKINSTKKKGLLLAQNIGKQISESIAVYDFSTVNKTLTSTLKDKDIVYVMLVNNELMPLTYRLSVNYFDTSAGTPFLNENKKITAYISKLENIEPLKDEYSKKILSDTQITMNEIELKKEKLSVYDFVIPIIVAESHFGYVRIGFSLDEMYKIIRKIEYESRAKTIAAIEKIKNDAILKNRKRLNKVKKDAVFFTFIFSFLGFFLSIFLAKRISKPISQMVKAMNDAENGNLLVSVDLKTGDELENLGKSFNNMMKNLSSIVKKVNHNAEIVNFISNTLAISSSESLNSIESIAKNIKEISQGAQTNAEMVIRTKDNTEELADTAKIINSQVNLALENSFNMQGSASEGDKVVENVIFTISDIKEEVNKMADIINRLYESSSLINKIIKTISQITAKTNTLAFNVSISAVKAGKEVKEIIEIGNQVRQLANENAAAASEIVSIVNDLEDKTNIAYKVMQKTVERTDDGVLLASQAGKKIKEILKTGKNLRKFISEISPLVQTQSEATFKIQSSIDEIATVAEQSSYGTTKASDFINEQTHSIEKVTLIGEELQEAARKLEESMTQFITDSKE